MQSGKKCDRVHDVARVTAFDYADIRSGYAASNIKATGNQRTSKGVEGGGPGVISGIIPASAWRDRNSTQEGQPVR